MSKSETERLRLALFVPVLLVALCLSACGSTTHTKRSAHHPRATVGYSSHAPLTASPASISSTLANIDLVVSSTLPAAEQLVNAGELSDNLSSCWVPAAGAYIDFTSYSDLTEGVCSGATNATESRPSGTTIACAAVSSTASSAEVVLMVYADNYQTAESVCSAVDGDTAWSIDLNFNAAAFNHALVKTSPVTPSYRGTRQTSGTSNTSSGSCNGEVVHEASIGTWMLDAKGVNCAAAHSVFNRYEMNTFPVQDEGTIGRWQCRETKLVPFKAGSDDGYEAWRCTSGATWVTFALGDKALASAPGSTPSNKTPAGFTSATDGNTSISGGSHLVAGGSYSGTATVGPWGPVTDQATCPGQNGFSVDQGTTSCEFGAAVFAIVNAAYQATREYPAEVTATSPVTHQTYTLSCQGGGDAGSLTDPNELVCSVRNAGVTIPIPIAAATSPEKAPTYTNNNEKSRTTATGSTNSSVPKTVGVGGNTMTVDQSHPRPPCPSGDEVSGASGNVYCIVSATQHSTSGTSAATTQRTQPASTTGTIAAYTGDGFVIALTNGLVYEIPDTYANALNAQTFSTGDTVQINGVGTTMIDTTTGNTFSVSKVGTTSGSNAFAAPHQSSIQDVGTEGGGPSDPGLIVLNDNSIWFIPPSDADNDVGNTQDWSAGDPITVSKGNGGMYTLADSNEGSSGNSTPAYYVGKYRGSY